MELTLLGGAFLAGFLSFISPCVLPLLPTFSLILAKNSQQDGGEARRLYANTTAFLAGFTLVFVMLGATASLIGSWLFSYQEVLRQGAAVLIIAMGLFMTGWIRIPLLLREYRPFQRRGFGGIGGAFLLGCGFTLGWTPCTGPMLATILLYAGDTATVGAGALLLFVYSLGFSVPFFMLAGHSTCGGGTPCRAWHPSLDGFSDLSGADLLLDRYMKIGLPLSSEMRGGHFNVCF